MVELTTIGVLGHFGNRNLGDEAIIAATLEQIRRRMGKAEIVCFSLRPDDTAFRHGVETFPVRHSLRCSGPVAALSEEPEHLPWKADIEQTEASGSPVPDKGWRQRVKSWPAVGHTARLAVRVVRSLWQVALELCFSLKAVAYLRRIDLLVIAGSNQFLDNFGGVWAFPYGLLRWTTLAKLTGTKVAFMSVGAGPLDAACSRLFVRCAIRLADYVSYRDAGSKQLVEAGLPKVDGEVFPDLAFGLSPPDGPVTRASDGPPIVGINPMPVYDARYWFEHDQARYSSFVRDLAAFAAKLVRAGNSVFLFPTMWRDDDVIHDVIKVLSSEHMLALERDFAYRPNDSVQGLVDVIRSADIIVATRFHAAVLAYHLGLPVLGIGYYRKTRELMEQLGQGKYYLPFDKCGVDALWEKFVELDASRLAEAEAIARKTQDSRRRVEEQWDEVLGLVGFERPTRSSERVVPIGNLGAR